ncbi:MAG: STAS domain-containing protein [Paracoccaceae bacterium]|nr:STAS domain-containing protein [Paracoccaceae bacterium]
MKLNVTQDGAVNIIQVDETRIDAAVAIDFKDQMRILTADLAGRVLLDLAKVDFIDSSGLGAVVAAMKQMPDGQKLELVDLTEAVDKVFRMTRMDTIFRIHSDLAQAQAAG